MSGSAARLPYQYVVLRCVPRVEREEFVNVGVVVYCQKADFLASAAHVDEQRLRGFSPGIDVDAVRRTLERVEQICRGPERGESDGPAGSVDRGVRFGYLKAPRSTVVQPGPVHGGLTTDPAAELQRLVDLLVR